MPTTVQLSATFDVNGKKVLLTSGDGTSQGIKWSLAEPVPLGSIQNFSDWMNNELGADIHPETVDVPDGKIKDAYQHFLDGVVILEALVINQPEQTYKFGVVYQLQEGLSLIGSLKFDGIGLTITKQPEGHLAEGITKETKSIKVILAEGAEFAPNDSIQIEDEIMVVKGVGDAGDQLQVERDNATAVDHKKKLAVSKVKV
jgi:hypothetical protein